LYKTCDSLSQLLYICIEQSMSFVEINTTFLKLSSLLFHKFFGQNQVQSSLSTISLHIQLCTF
jgi:hypothetical protein